MAALGSDVDAIINFAAESHVDRSIESADEFVRTNVLGTQVLLDCARARKVRRFVQVSTDEVMGSLVENDAAFFS
jgi:dTDP-glucose 4,6-dehydratase